jgi:hypothetical protein
MATSLYPDSELGEMTSLETFVTAFAGHIAVEATR